MLESLNQKFINLLSKYSDDKMLADEYWKEIKEHYSDKSRYYHNLDHIASMIFELETVKSEIEDWNSVLFSIFYHDIIYKSSANDNEEKSAEIAKNRLQKINLSYTQINKIYNQILATKKHQLSADSETNYLLDADLSILGKSWNEYENYTKQIRKEYSIYPDFMYNPGRKKVLEHFLTFSNIYKTDFFRTKYEFQARKNILKEIELL